MGLNLSNHQMAKELELKKDDGHQMTCQLRQGMVIKKPLLLSPTRGNVMRSTLSLATRGSPLRGSKRAAWPAQTTQGETRTWHTRNGEATDLRDDPARWSGGDSDA